MRPFAKLILLLSFAAFYISWSVISYKHTLLPTNLENKLQIVRGVVISVTPSANNDIQNFLFRNNADSRLIKLSWHKPEKTIYPKQGYQLAVKLKRPRNFKNPGSFNFERYCMQKNIIAVGYVVASSKNILIKDSLSNVGKLRINYLNYLMAKYNNKELPIVLALLLGYSNYISQEQKEVIDNTGIGHLFAVSGMHIGICSAVVFIVLKLLAINYRLATIINICISIVYALFTGFAVSSQRAIIMLIAAGLGVLTRRYIPIRQRIFLALFCILLVEPLSIFGYGLWLSFGSLIALLYIGRGGIIYRNFYLLFATIPLNVMLFAKLPLASVLANIIAIPWISFITLPLAFLNLIPLSCMSVKVLWKFLPYLAKFPVINLVQGRNQFLLLFISLSFGLWFCAPKGFRGRYFAILNLVFLCFKPQTDFKVGDFMLNILDVGQGLAVVIQTKDQTIIYDVGPPVGVIRSYLNYKGIKKINKLIISHNDLDHSGDLLSVIKNFTVLDFFTSEPLGVEQENIEYKACHAGYAWQANGVNFEFIYPFDNIRLLKKNNNSCVLKISNSKYQVLLPGDIEAVAEKHLLDKYKDQLHNLKSEILVVPHHGSKSSSTIDFINAVNPKYALVSAGYLNRYQHPHSKILDLYKNLNIKTVSTQQAGILSFLISNEGYSLL